MSIHGSCPLIQESALGLDTGADLVYQGKLDEYAWIVKGAGGFGGHDVASGAAALFECKGTGLPDVGVMLLGSS